MAKLYDLARWKRIAKRQLDAEPLCAFCLCRGRVEPAVVCDHIDGHPADETVDQFWSGPFQSLCQRCHNSDKRKSEHLSTSKAVACDVNGWPMVEQRISRGRAGRKSTA